MGILGELPLEKGSVKVQGRVAYASQQPWVFSASVRQNIIFGRAFDEKKYNRCIKAAALVKVKISFVVDFIKVIRIHN